MQKQRAGDLHNFKQTIELSQLQKAAKTASKGRFICSYPPISSFRRCLA